MEEYTTVETRELAVKLDGKEIVFKLKKLNAGERNIVRKQAMDVSVKSGEEANTKVDIGSYQDFLIIYSLVEPTEFKDKTKLHALPPELYDNLATVATELSNLSGDPKK